MNVLIIGNGGREAAIAREVLKSKHIRKLFMNPYCDFYKGKVQSFDVPINDHPAMLQKITDEKIDLVIIGPEQPLVDGLSDYLRENRVYVFGPSQKGAMLEGSKIFCKEFLTKAEIPTGQFEECKTYEEVLDKSQKFHSPWILKADGLASGKGVYICSSAEELEKAARELLVEKKLGETRVFLEENLPGTELSFLILTSGSKYLPLPVAQDHKRIKDRDQGANTGGMGAVAPVQISEDLREKIENKVIKPFMKQLAADQIDYRGIVYFGIMMVRNDPFVLEINARFGDPEAQVILPLLEGDWLEIFHKTAQGDSLITLKWKKKYAASVVLAAPGYPGITEKNIPIEGDLFEERRDSYFIPAGVKKSVDKFVTNGGRVLNAIGLGDTAAEAVANANKKSKEVKWQGLQKRTDIGYKVLRDDKFIF